MIRKIALFTFLFICSSAVAQDDSNALIDRISIQLINCFQEGDIEILDCYFVRKDDVLYLLDSLKDKMKEEEVEQAMAEIDSLPKTVRRQWLRKFDNAKTEANRFITDWSKVNYLTSDIELEMVEFVMRNKAKVVAKFEFQGITYSFRYDCVDMPRGWLFGNELSFEFETEDSN